MCGDADRRQMSGESRCVEIQASGAQGGLYNVGPRQDCPRSCLPSSSLVWPRADRARLARDGSASQRFDRICFSTRPTSSTTMAGAKPTGNAICNIPPSRPEACGIRRLITATKRCAAISGKMLTASRQSQQRVGDGAGERLLYDPTEAAINKSWKPGEIDERSGSRARSSINAELRHENRPRQYRPWPRHGRARPSAAGALDPRVFNPG